MLYATAYVATGVPGIVEMLPAKAALLRMLSYPFVIGMAFHVLEDRVRLSWLGVGALALLAAALRQTPLFEPAFVAAIAYGTFVLAYLPGGAARRYNAVGDYSYGMYVYAFPVQQAAVALWGPMSPSANIAVAFPVTLLFAIASWYLVEKPALDRRHVLARALGACRREEPVALAHK